MERWDGQTGAFYGAHANRFKIGNVVYEAIEDENDYRSTFKEGVVVVSKDQSPGVFSVGALATVRVLVRWAENTDEHRNLVGCALEDVDDAHIWLRMGAKTAYDFSPRFVFQYTPKLVRPTGDVFAPATFAERMRLRRARRGR